MGLEAFSNRRRNLKTHLRNFRPRAPKPFLAVGTGLLLLCLSPAVLASDLATLVVCDDVRDPMTLDPHKEFTEKNHTLVQQIYEGLVRFNAQGRIEPALAVSWKRMDPLRVRFELRPDVRFHNGEDFNAEAVKFSIERYLDPKTGFPALGFINAIARVDIVDPLTVDIVTHFPDGLLLNRLAGFVLIVPPRYVAEKGDGALQTHPVGTGPFCFAAWLKNDKIVLLANENYWMDGSPKIKRLVFRFLSEKEQVEALFAGSVDLVTELPGTATTAVARRKNLRVGKVPTFYAVAGSFNLNRGPLAQKAVRQAINLAVDRRALIRYDVLGNGRALATVTMPGEEGHDATLPLYPYDPEAAQKLLREAGFEKIQLNAVCKHQGERAFKIICQQLRRVGIDVQTRFFSDAESTAVMAERDWDMLFGGCPDPMVHSFFIQSIFLYSKSPYSVVKNKEYDGKLEEMVTTIDKEEREILAKNLDCMIREEHLMLPAYQRVKTYGYRDGVKFQPYITGMPYFFSIQKEDPHAAVTSAKN